MTSPSDQSLVLQGTVNLASQSSLVGIGPLGSSGTFGGSLRQSQIGLEAFGPTIAGARTSANVQFDFAGGFPYTPNGVSFGHDWTAAVWRSKRITSGRARTEPSSP